MISSYDLIIPRLLQYTEAPLDTHLNDVKGVMKIQANGLDAAYIEEWCGSLSVVQLWKQLRSEMNV